MSLKPPTIKWSQLWSGSFVSYRRLLLDLWLDEALHLISGTVIDVGGKNINKRGAFRPVGAQIKSWVYLNLDTTTKPHIQADACVLPISNECADCVMCTETIEHLREPNKCIAELFRILKADGTLILSVPFLYPVHADPYDFQRYTVEGLKQLCCNFTNIDIYPMGGHLGVIGMFLELRAEKAPRSIKRALLWRIGRILTWMDASCTKPKTDHDLAYTTGYFVVCRK